MALDSVQLQVSLTCPRCHQPLHLQGLTLAAHCGSCSSSVRVPEAVWAEWFGGSELLAVLDDLDTRLPSSAEVIRRVLEGDVRDVAMLGARLEQALARVVDGVELEDEDEDDEDEDDDDEDEDEGDEDDEGGDEEGLDSLDVVIEEQVWTEIGRMRPAEDPVLHQAQSQAGGLEARCQYGASPAHCVKCKAPTPLAGLEAAAAAGGYGCACGERVAVRTADPLVRRLIPEACFVVGEGPLGADDDPVVTAEPVLFQCMGCGAGLSVDGRSRNVRCTFCSSANYLPDGLWLRLHPPRVIRPFFVLAPLIDEGGPTERTLAFLGRSSSWQARRKAAWGTSDPVLLAALAKDDDSDVRQAVGSNSAASAETLGALARDGSYGVRCCVARNPRTPPEVIDALLTDSDSDVRKAVRDHPNVSVDLLVRLLDDSSYDLRRTAMADPRIPPERLVARAGRETDNDVLNALFDRQDLTPAVLAALATNRDRDAQRRAAAHPQTPPEALLKLAAVDDSAVRRAVSDREDLSEEVLLALVRTASARRDEQALRRLVRRTALPLEALEIAAAHSDEQVAAAARLHPTWVAHVGAARRRRAIAAGVGGALLLSVGVLGAGGVGLLFGLRLLFRVLF